MTLQEAGKKVLRNVQKEHNYLVAVSCLLVMREDGVYLVPSTGRDKDGGAVEFYQDIQTERQYAPDYEVKL